jgi:hypothetical protein
VASQADDDFAIPPAAPAGVRTITVAQLRQDLLKPSRPVVLDVGIGAATIAGSVWIRFPDSKVGGLDDCLAQIPGGSIVVIVGDGFYGQGAYSAASRAVRSGHANVELLIGGEEALAAADFPTIDRRSP